MTITDSELPQTSSDRPASWPDEVRAFVADLGSRQRLVGFAVGVVREGRFEFVGHGLADRKSGRVMTQDTVVRIASITKTLTAVGIMQLVEQDVIDLDAPANDYLASFQLVPRDADWRPATIRHLLTHTAGLGELAHVSGTFKSDFGESFEAGTPMPSLAEFYGGELAIKAEPGTRYVYNNHGPATLGQIVEDVSGQSLADFLQEHIFEPLGMSSSDLRRSDEVQVRLATGYEIGLLRKKRVKERDMVTDGAASVYSTARDMGRYMAALLGGGANEHGRVLEPDSVASMFEPHYQPDPSIPGMGLAFFRKTIGGHTVVGHQGTHPGFHSQMLLAPKPALV